MADRREVARRKARLLQDLRASYRNGGREAGELAPSVRDLAKKYEISVGLVAQQMQILVKEGVFYTITGAGTFVGRKTLNAAEFYLLVLAGTRHEEELKAGFEEGIAAQGGTTLVMTPEQVAQSVRRDALPIISGLYLFRGLDLDPVRTALQSYCQESLPEVNFDDMRQESHPADVVNFDDDGGGRQAAAHLRQGGHSAIAFLAIHAADDAHDCYWSVRRMEGWQSVLERDGIKAQNLAFLPTQNAVRSRPNSVKLLRSAAKRLLQESGATAVVASSDDAALQLIEACRDLSLPSSQWPAIVSFDGTLPLKSTVLTSLRLPWEELGRQAAKTLWERVHGQITGAPVHRVIPMRMVPRLTCSANWSLVESLQTVF